MTKAGVLVAGVGGFIGNHLAKYLVGEPSQVGGVGLRQPEYKPSPAQESELLDPRRFDNCLIATRGIDEVYRVTSDMEITGYLTAFHAELLAYSSFVTFSKLLEVYTLVIEPLKWLQAPNATSSALRTPLGHLRTKAFRVLHLPS